MPLRLLPEQTAGNPSFAAGGRTRLYAADPPPLSSFSRGGVWPAGVSTPSLGAAAATQLHFTHTGGLVRPLLLVERPEPREFYGHTKTDELEKNTYGKGGKLKHVVTHISQPNTIEWNMSLEWRLVRNRQELETLLQKRVRVCVSERQSGDLPPRSWWRGHTPSSACIHPLAGTSIQQ